VSKAQESRIRELERQLELAQEENAKLKAKIAELERRLLQFENPHTPPSLRVKAKKRPPKHGKPGQKPGHEGFTRLQPIPERTERVEIGTCPHCRARLGKPVKVERDVIEEMPEPQPAEVICYETLHYRCHRCGREIVSVHPDKPKSGRFGANAQTMMTLKRYCSRLPHRKVTETMREEHGFTITPATVWNTTKSVAGHLKPGYDEIVRMLRKSPFVHIDETSYKVDGKKWWHWVFTTGDATVFAIRKSRGVKVIREFLGRRYKGVIVSDGLCSYASYGGKRQRCWAHILREFKELGEKDLTAKVLHDELRKLYDSINEALSKGPPPEERRGIYKKAKEQLQWLLAANRRGRSGELVRKMRKGGDNWLTFILHPGVEPTNNRAERALREGIVLRKIIGTLRNGVGAEVHAINMSMIATWKQRGENPYRVLKPLLCCG